ncbi:MAG: sensor histidine kinase [Actinomycetota bacterium]|nr:sensor histidine kinase [Actinomycetota bacterium]
MTLTRLLDYLPRGNLLDDTAWRTRHQLVLWVLGLHLPALFVFALWLRHSLPATLVGLVPLIGCMLLGIWKSQRRAASFFTSAGLVYCSAALVVFSRGSIEAHFHFFIIIGIIALYQDWVPFLWNILFTVLSHGIGTAWQAGLMFNHPAAQANPWVWSLIHGVAVLLACIGVVIFWRTTEDEQHKSMRLATQLADVELSQRKFTSELLVNLARRNQSMLYRQLDIISQLEEKERDPDALGDLFRLDHLATRIRRNAESLLVLSGEEAPRTWSEPVALIDVLRAAIAETEHLDRVDFSVDERLAVLGRTVTDLTHVLAELVENAVQFSPPESKVTIRTRSCLRTSGEAVITIEDWGVGMPPEDLAHANDLLASPRDIDLSASQRLGLHVVARLAVRHRIRASLSTTPGSGITAVVALPADLFADDRLELTVEATTGSRNGAPAHVTPTEQSPLPPTIPQPRGPARSGSGLDRNWTGWWTPTRLPTVEESSWSPAPAAPAYATVQKVVPAVALPITGPQLNRRVPQASLAPELRQTPARGAAVAAPTATSDAKLARDALSRYQASRQAAQEQLDTRGRS